MQRGEELVVKTSGMETKQQIVARTMYTYKGSGLSQSLVLQNQLNISSSEPRPYPASRATRKLTCNLHPDILLKALRPTHAWSTTQPSDWGIGRWLYPG